MGGGGCLLRTWAVVGGGCGGGSVVGRRTWWAALDLPMPRDGGRRHLRVACRGEGEGSVCN